MNNINDKGILIGWASRDVTPDKPVILRGQFHVRISEKIQDPVTATVLALESEDKSEHAFMVSVDTTSINNCVRDECRKRLSSKIPEIDAIKLFLNATHTHTAPAQPGHIYPPQAPEVATDEEVFELLVNGIVDAAVEAWNGRKLGAIGWGKGQAVVGLNRRWTSFDGVSTMYGNTSCPEFSHIEGYEDHGVDMLFTYNSADELTGMILNLACPSQVTEGAHFISADYWHEVRCEIRKRHGAQIYILPQCSAAGDQSPHLLYNKAAEARMMELKGFGDDFNMAQRQEIALRLANAVDEVLPLVNKDIKKSVPFFHEILTIDLPMRKVTDDDVKYCQEQVTFHEEALAKCKPDPADLQYSRNYMRIRYFGRVIERFKTQGDNPILPMESHIVRLGDVAFATNRFEYFLDFGIRIKTRSKALQTFIVQLSGEGTYLPTEKAVAGKSYGAGIESNLVGPDGGQKIVETQVETINRIFE